MARTSSCRVFEGDFHHLAALCGEEVTSAAELEAQLQKIYAQVFNVDFARYDLRRLREAAAEHLDDFYDLRIALRGRIAKWQAAGFIYVNAREFQIVASVAEGALRNKQGEALLEYPCWAAPILAHRLLYVRGKDHLVCLDLRPESYR